MSDHLCHLLIDRVAEADGEYSAHSGTYTLPMGYEWNPEIDIESQKARASQMEGQGLKNTLISHVEGSCEGSYKWVTRSQVL